jgi:hypothetical protein
MRVDEKDGKVILVLDIPKSQWDVGDIFRLLLTLRTSDEETTEKHKLKLSRFLDYDLKGRKIDEIREGYEPKPYGEVLEFFFRGLNPKFKNQQRQILDIKPYISDAKWEQLMEKYPLIKDFWMKKDYNQVMKELDTKAAEYNAQNDKESAEIAAKIGPDFSTQKLPPAEYRGILPKYGARRTRVARSRKRRARKTNRRKY